MSDHHNALDVLRAQRRARQGVARIIARGLAETAFYGTNRGELLRALRQAKQEDEQYHALTGEPPPTHVVQALRVELSYWTRYDDLLRATPVPEDEYAQFCRNLQPRAAQLVSILSIEQELLDNPLIAYHLARLHQASGGTPQVSTTRNPVRALAQVRNDLEERARLAHLTYRHVLRETFFAASTTDLTYAWNHAAEDTSVYEDATGEPYPAHAQHANTFERSLWNHLSVTHERGAKHPARAHQRLRPIARILERTLELEDDLLTTPLVAYYERQLELLALAARRADRTYPQT